MNDILFIVFDKVTIGEFRNLYLVNKFLKCALETYFTVNTIDYNIYTPTQIVMNWFPLMNDFRKYTKINILLLMAFEYDKIQLFGILCDSMGANSLFLH